MHIISKILLTFRDRVCTSREFSKSLGYGTPRATYSDSFGHEGVDIFYCLKTGFLLSSLAYLKGKGEAFFKKKNTALIHCVEFIQEETLNSNRSFASHLSSPFSVHFDISFASLVLLLQMIFVFML